jgi:endonuclease/exonuclease/phosphatase family metal-dependent hydrolase
MRIVTWNVEWFTNLFDARGRLLEDEEWSSRYKVTRRQQIESIAIVLTAIDPDAVMVIEAPDNNRRRQTVPMLERFAARFDLRCRRALLGFENDTQQEIALLHDPDVLTVHHDPKGGGEGETPRFDQSYLIDLDVDGTADRVVFSKPPLEVQAETRDGKRFRLIGAHLKTKAPHGATTPEQAQRIAIANRRKQLAECIWLRARVLEHLKTGDSLLVMGDLNDGPGLDEYEKLFGRSGIEIVLGWDEPREVRLYDPHARIAYSKKTGVAPMSARFYLDTEKRYFSALLDYIMVSPDLRALKPSWRIWHPFDDPDCYHVEELREALLMASDHFPVSIDLPI